MKWVLPARWPTGWSSWMQARSLRKRRRRSSSPRHATSGRGSSCRRCWVIEPGSAPVYTRLSLTSGIPMADPVSALQAILGPKGWLSGADADPYRRDWLNRYGVAPLGVARPANTAEVAAVVKTCLEFG